MKRYTVTLEQEERDALAAITRKGSHPLQKVVHALILLNCDEGECNERRVRGEAIVETLRSSTGCASSALAPSATRKVTLVMDNLSTHRPGALDEALAPAAAQALRDRCEFVSTPQHSRWLPVAEVELSVLIRQGLPPPQRLPRGAARRGRGLAGGPRPPPELGQLAVHHGRRAGEAETPLSNTL